MPSWNMSSSAPKVWPGVGMKAGLTRPMAVMGHHSNKNATAPSGGKARARGPVAGMAR